MESWALAQLQLQSRRLGGGEALCRQGGTVPDAGNVGTLRIQGGQCLPQLRRRKQIDRRGEQLLAPPVIIVGQQGFRQGRFFVQLRPKGRRAHRRKAFQVPHHIPVREERVILHGLCEAGTGVLGALAAKFRRPALPAAPDEGAALVPLSSAAAGTVPAPVHGTQAAAKAAQGKGGVRSPVALHTVCAPAGMGPKCPKGSRMSRARPSTYRSSTTPRAT